jgi:hypothetical protein
MVLKSRETRKESVGTSSYVILTCHFTFLSCKSKLRGPQSCDFRWTCCTRDWWQMGTGVYWNNICHAKTAIRVEKSCPTAILSNRNPIWTAVGLKTELRRHKSVTNLPVTSLWQIFWYQLFSYSLSYIASHVL